MTDPSPRAPRTVSTPLVLAVASAMVCIGVAAVLGPELFTSEPPSSEAGPPLVIDTDTPEAAAESYLDAFRRREHEAAIELSVEDAQAQARERMERDVGASIDEQAAKQRLWDRMSVSRLRFVVEEREPLPEGGVRLRGRAVGRFLEHPYVRVIEFDMVQVGGAHRVARMELGAILRGPDLAVTPGARLPRERP